jgi:Uncharacterized homolog of phage Mu protein gp47
MIEMPTYQTILMRMIERVKQADSNLDTREGSVIFNALAPAAVELVNMYIQLNTILNETYADTATREYLIKRVSEFGIVPYPATNAIVQGEFNMNVPIGSRFSLQNTELNYVVVERISTGIYRLQCETPGSVANDRFGRLIPIDFIAGLTTARLTQLLIPGEDVEETEHLRQRFFDSLDSTAFGGNIKDYKEHVTALQGVGGVKVHPVWNGGGTVKLVIIDSDYNPPTQALIASVQTAIDPTQNQGLGYGIAPIGHVVTVTGVSSTTINIVINLTLESGWTWDDIKPFAETAIDDYFTELASQWDNTEVTVVRISNIEVRLLALQGVIDVYDTTLNGQAQNMILGSDYIPIRGTLNVA